MSTSKPPPLVEESADVDWENTLQRDPYDVELWLEYAQDKTRRGLTAAAVAMVYERALARLPGSYKLWISYLKARRSWIEQSPAIPGSEVVLGLNATFERSLVFMNKMPKIWLAYCAFLVEQRAITLARRMFDRALCALPSTQHGEIWTAYTNFALQVSEVPWQTAERILTRRCHIDPEEGRAALVVFLKSRSRFGEAARELFRISNENNTTEDRKKSVRTELISLVRSYPDECRDFVDLETICRQVPKEQTEERVKHFSALGDYYIRLGEFDASREVFEETMTKECQTIRDFSSVFEMYSKLEEAILDESEAAGEGEEEVEFRVMRMRDLIDRRTRFAGGIYLNAWTGDIQERLALAKFFERTQEFTAMEATILAAFPSTEPLELMNGRGSDLFTWLAGAQSRRVQSTGGNEIQARNEHDRVLALGCRSCWDVRDVVELWRIRIETEIASGNAERALKLAKESITPPLVISTDEGDDSKAKQPRRPVYHKSYQLWALYLDLEENFGAFESCRAAYEQAMDLKICSVLMILNYCKMLRKRDFHEDSYVVFERAIAMFPWPHARDLWIEYAKQFVDRYEGTKVERTRDLFEQCIRSIPETGREQSEFAFLAYGRFEETHGLSRRAMNVYERWCEFVPDKQKYDAYLVWATRTEELFGAPAARKVYEKAVSVLPELDVSRICIRFADMERRLGEFERARALFKHGSQFTDPADPKKDVGLWQAWNDFEVNNGNEETFRDMLRVKRSVQAHFGVLHATDAVTNRSSSAISAANVVAAPNGESQVPSGEDTAVVVVESQYFDPGEIDIDEDEDAPEDEDDNQAETRKKMGALERLTADAASV